MMWSQGLARRFDHLQSRRELLPAPADHRTRRELPPSHRHLGHLCSTRCLALINRGRRQRMLSVRTATATTLWRPSGSSCSCRRPSRQWSLGSKQAKQGSPTNVPSGPRGPQR
eukprot:s755_g31.t1